jgi:predicted DNA binding CopG/RHH family protein
MNYCRAHTLSNSEQQSNKKVFWRQKVKKATYLDKDEMELAKSLENEEWVSDLTEKEKKQYEEFAQYSLNKQKRINIRMSERDLKKIRADGWFPDTSEK